MPLFNIVKATMQMHVNKKQSTPIFEEDEIIMLMLSILNTQLNDGTLPLKKAGDIVTLISAYGSGNSWPTVRGLQFTPKLFLAVSIIML